MSAGGREYVIEGTGVADPIRVPVDFDQNQVFEFSIIVDFEKGFIEMKTNEREIGAALAYTLRQQCRLDSVIEEAFAEVKSHHY